MRTNKEREKMLNSFADPETSDEGNFSITRDKGDELAFSQEVINQFKDDLFLFIAGRICAFQNRTDKPAQTLTVNIKVDVGSLVKDSNERP